MQKNIFRNIVLYLILLAASVRCPAQNSITQQFRYLTTNDGLGDNTVWSILQDNYGFMWFATMDGLYKLEGNQLRAIHKNFFKEKGYGNTVEDIAEDKKNEQLWLLVQNQIFSLDLKTEKIAKENLLNGCTIEDLYADDKGLLWIATIGKGIYTYDKNAGKLQKWNRIKEFDAYDVIEITQDDEGLYCFLVDNKGVMVYNPQQDKTYSYFDSLHGITTFLKDAKDQLWVGTCFGLYRWDDDKRQYEEIMLKRKEEHDIFFITDIVERSTGEIYISTDSGLFVYHHSGPSLTHLKADYLAKGTLNNNYLNSIFFDKENTLWIATYFGGVNYMSENSQNFTYYDFINAKMGGHVVSGFAEDDDGNLWISTEDGGISFWNKRTNEVTNYNPQESEETFLDFYNAHTLLIDGDVLYAGMSNTGLTVFNVRTKETFKIRNTAHHAPLSGNSIYSLFKIDENRLAIGTISGLDILDISTRTTSPVKDIPQKTINCILRDKDGGIWTCGKDLGIFYKAKDEEWKDFCKDNSAIPTRIVYTIATKDKYLYIGTQDYGVIVYDFIHKQYQYILSKELQNSIVFDIIPNENELWLCTSNGLYQYDFANGKVHHFTEDDELTSRQLNINSSIRMKDGTIFVGTVNGLNGFRSQDLIFNDIAPNTALTSIKINNETMLPGEAHSMLTHVLPYTKEIELRHDQSNISITFTSLSHTGNKKTTYKYKLEPDQPHWIYTQSNTLNFNKMPTGKYRLCVKSCNDNGIWDPEGSTLEITILPPWWWAWYMKFCYALLFFAALGWTFYYSKHKQEKRIKEMDIRKSEEIYKSKMEFFTNVIHDIRTPLTLIMAPLQTLMKRKDAQPFKFELDIIQRNSERLLNQVNQLMDFRKAEQPSNEIFALMPTDIVKEIENLVNEFSPSAHAKGIELNIRRKGDHGALLVNGNKEIIDKVFSNLMSNALKFTSTEINIVIEETESECTVTVQDDGIGISDELKSHIFEPFYQIRESLPKDYIGTGIGLSIVSNLVKKMNGSLHLESKPNAGSSFAVTFPLLNAKEEDVLNNVAEDGPTMPAEQVAVPAAPAATKKSIALLEDNEDMRAFIVSLLKDEFEVADYPSGNAFFEDASEKNFDIIISDIMMPGMDGYEVCRKVKENTDTSHIPVILLTAKVQDKDEIEGLNIGADAYVKKPFTPDVLIARINNLIRSREQLLSSYRKVPETKLTDIIENEKDVEFITKVNQIIYENLTNPELSVPFVAKQMCVSRSLFFVKIKGVSGMTFVDYVRVARLKRAVELMRSGTDSINEISDLVGFSTPSYFCRCFKQQFNIPPSEYLKNMQERA